MHPQTLIDEIALLRLRQRKLLRLLSESKVINWDGAIETDDPEFVALRDDIFSRWNADQEALTRRLEELAKEKAPTQSVKRD